MFKRSSGDNAAPRNNVGPTDVTGEMRDRGKRIIKTDRARFINNSKGSSGVCITCGEQRDTCVIMKVHGERDAERCAFVFYSCFNNRQLFRGRELLRNRSRTANPSLFFRWNLLLRAFFIVSFSQVTSLEMCSIVIQFTLKRVK